MREIDIQRISRFCGITVMHPRMNAVFDKLSYLRQMSRGLREMSASEKLGRPSLEALPMIAPTGSGKTKIIETYIRRANSEAVNTGLTPILYTNLSTNLTVKGFYADVLKSFGDPNFARGTQQQLEQKMQTFIRARGVELLVIDEVHHLISAETNKVKWDVAEIFKNILNDRTCSVVLSGIEKASFLFENESQLARRCIAPVPLGPLNERIAEERDLFIGFLARLDEEMASEGVTEGRNDLLSGDIPGSIFEVSGGRIGIASQLIRAALVASLERGATRVSREDLDRATEIWAKPSGFAKRNPFRASRVE